MLNDDQRTRVWQNMLAAEARALYFADLTSSYTMRKQWITGISFLLSSSAAATIVGSAPSWVPVLLALAVAGATAYSVALNLDGRIRTMAKLHSSWNQIAVLYDRLWNHTDDSDAEDEFSKILEKEREPSELAALSAPNDEKRMEKWLNRVFAMYHLPINA
jgi:hypothetical protein